MKAGQLTTLLSFLILTGCGVVGSTNNITSKDIIDKATEKCAINDGLFAIINASVEVEFESCGPKCSRKTGISNHTGEAVCQNGARFNMSFSMQTKQLRND